MRAGGDLFRRRLRALAWAFIASLAWSSASAQQLLRNGSFEQGLDGWLASVPQVAVEVAGGSDGSDAVRLSAQTSRPATALQRLDVLRHGGQVLDVRALVKGGKAGFAHLWVRYVHPQTSRVAFIPVQRPPLDDAKAWQALRLLVYVPEGLKELLVAVSSPLESPVLFDDVSVVPYSAPASAAATKTPQVLEAALEAIRSLALNVGNVNWPAIERAAMGIVSERSPEFGEIQAVQFALTSLGDGHSHLLPAPTAASNALHAEDADIPHAVLGRASYVALPRFVAMSDDASSRFASRVRMLLDTASARPDHCGWILDLRSNSGGNMYPMLAGLWPLLGDGDLGHFDFPSGRKAWGMESGSFPGRMPSLRALPPATPVLQRQRVALLIGPRTASSGEIVAIAFAGRHGVRSFGHQTAGQASANRAVPLPDGSILALTVAQVSDRSGRVYPQGIEPDVRLPLPAVAANSSDEVALAATAWLEEGCR